MSRHLAALGDRPHDERSPALDVAAGKYAALARHVSRVYRDRAARVELEPELLDQAGADRTAEAHGQEHEITGNLQLRALHGNKLPALHLDPLGMELFDLSAGPG